MSRDFYAILGVPRNGSEEQIRQRFHELARERHPDRFLGDQKLSAESIFQDITQAFNVLVDPERRRQYDLELSKPRESSADPKQLARAFLQRGVKAYRDRNLIEASENFERAARTDPANAQAWYNFALTVGQNPSLIGRAALAIERACELEPMNGVFWRQAGRLLALAGKQERALNAYRKAIEWGEDEATLQQAIDELSRSGRRSGLFGKGS
jgi:curved DNA-binding protein CbpA